jgi:hypothetical protein
MWKRYLRHSVLTAAIILGSSPSFSQDLVELAARERLRRQQAGSADKRISIERMPSDTNEKTGDSGQRKEYASEASKRRSETQPSNRSDRKENHTRWVFLSRRGPTVMQELQKEHSNLELGERELSNAQRSYPSSWRRGMEVEDSRLIAARRNLEQSKRRLSLLEQEWRRLEDEVRRSGWPPGLLRGQLP